MLRSGWVMLTVLGGPVPQKYLSHLVQSRCSSTRPPSSPEFSGGLKLKWLFGPFSAPQHTRVAPFQPLLTSLGVYSSYQPAGTTSSTTGTQCTGVVRGTIQMKNVRVQGWFQGDKIGRSVFPEHEPWVRLSAIEWYLCPYKEPRGDLCVL